MRGGTAGLAHVAVSLGLFQGSVSLVSSVSKRARNITDQWGSMQDVVVAISRVLEMLGQTPEQSVSERPRDPAKIRERHNFRGRDVSVTTRARPCSPA